MPRLIKNKQLVDDSWKVATDDFDFNELSSQKWLLPYPLFSQVQQESQLDFQSCGPILNAEDDVMSIEPIIGQLKIIALNFNAFTDGRSFSQARVLRDHLDFEGEIRAIGNFIQDQLFYLSRCGVDAFLLPDHTSVESALVSLSDFSECYQAACDEPQPLFRRRV